MRKIRFIALFALSLGGLAACATPAANSIVASISAHCDEYEGYPDCYPDHPLGR